MRPRRPEIWVGRATTEGTKCVLQFVDTLILDHHLLRCKEGLSWLRRLSSETGHRVGQTHLSVCSAWIVKSRLKGGQTRPIWSVQPPDLAIRREQNRSGIINAFALGHRVICAADFMGRPHRLLEAWREQLYAEMPVPKGWHEAYARGDADTRRYPDYVSVEGMT